MERVQQDRNNLEHASEKVWKNYYWLLQQSSQRIEEIQRAKDENIQVSPQFKANIKRIGSKQQSEPILQKSLYFWADFIERKWFGMVCVEITQLDIPPFISNLTKLQNSIHNQKNKNLANIFNDPLPISTENEDLNLIFDEMLELNDSYKEVQVKFQKCQIKYEAIKEQISKAGVVRPRCAYQKLTDCPIHTYYPPKEDIDWRFVERLINQNQSSIIMDDDLLKNLKLLYGKDFITQKQQEKQEEYQSISTQVSKVLKIFGAFYLDYYTLYFGQTNQSVLEVLNAYRLQTLEEFMSSYQNNPDYSKLRFIVFQFGLSEKLAFEWYIQNKLIIQLLRIQIWLPPTQIIYSKGKSKEEINQIKQIVDLKQNHSLELVANFKLAEERKEMPVEVDIIGFTVPDNSFKDYSFDDFKDPEKEESFKKEVELRLRELNLVPKDAIITIHVSKGSIKTSVLVYYLNDRAQKEQFVKFDSSEMIREEFNATNVNVVKAVPYRSVEIDDFDLQTRQYTWLDSIAGYFSARGPPNERQWYSVPGHPWIKLHLNIRNFKEYSGENQNWYRSGKVTGAWIQGYYCPYKMTTERINRIIRNRILPFTTYNPYNFSETKIDQYFYPGIYLYQDVNAIFQKCPSIKLGNVTYKVAFSCRINPEQLDIQQSEGLKIYYTFDHIHVRPTAVLIRPVE